MYAEEIKEESTLVTAIKNALLQGSVDSFRSDMTSRAKKVNKKIQARPLM